MKIKSHDALTKFNFDYSKLQFYIDFYFTYSTN